MRHTLSLLPLALLLVPSALAAHDLCWEFEEVNVPTDYGERPTSWWGVNNHDVFVGNYCVDEDCYVVGAAMYDARAGTIETFAPEEYEWTEWLSVNDHGQIAGAAYTYIEGYGPDGYVAIWEPDGEVTYLVNPDLGIVGGDYGGAKINNRGEVTGVFWDTDEGRYRGVIWTGPDEWTVYDACSDTEHVFLREMTDSGVLIGVCTDYSTWTYFIDEGEGPEVIPPPDAGRYNISAINNRGILVGSLRLEGSLVPLIKDGDDYTTFPIPGTDDSVFGDIAENGTVAATGDGYTRGFVGWRVPCH